MTPKYWLKIVLGMLAIFAVGMLGVSAIRGTGNKVRTVVASADPLTVPLLGMPFRTTGKGELGTLKTLRVERDSPREISGFHFTVALDDGVSADQFGNCEVTVTNPEHFDRNSTFSCLTAADSGFDELVRFGTVTFEPNGDVHRLMLPRQMVDEIRSAFADDSTAMGDSLSVDSNAANVKVKVGERTIVNVEIQP